MIQKNKTIKLAIKWYVPLALLFSAYVFLISIDLSVDMKYMVEEHRIFSNSPTSDFKIGMYIYLHVREVAIYLTVFTFVFIVLLSFFSVVSLSKGNENSKRCNMNLTLFMVLHIIFLSYLIYGMAKGNMQLINVEEGSQEHMVPYETCRDTLNNGINLCYYTLVFEAICIVLTLMVYFLPMKKKPHNIF